MNFLTNSQNLNLINLNKLRILNKKGAFWGLIIGLGVGLTRFIWEFSYESPPCGKSYLDKRPAIISKVHYLHFGIILFVITCASSWTISLLTKPIPDKYVRIFFLNFLNFLIYFSFFVFIDQTFDLFYTQRRRRADSDQRRQRIVLQLVRGRRYWRGRRPSREDRRE